MTKYVLYILLVSSFFHYQESQSQEWETSYNLAWEALSDKDSAFQAFNKGRTIALANNDNLGVVYCDQGLMYVSGYHYDLVQLEKDIELLKKDLQELEDSGEKEYWHAIYLLENVNLNYKLASYKNAQYYVDSLYTFINHAKTEYFKESQYSIYESLSEFQASIYKNQGKFEQAKETYRRLLNYIDLNAVYFEDILSQQFSIYRLLAQTHAQAGDLDKAIALEKRLLDDDELTNLIANNNSGTILRLTHVEHLLDAQQYKEALEQSLFCPQTTVLNTKFKLLAIENQARLYFNDKEYQQAFIKIDEAIKMSVDYRKSNSHPDVYELQLRKAKFLKDKGDSQQAFQLYNDLHAQAAAREKSLTFIDHRYIVKFFQGMFSTHSQDLSSDQITLYSKSLIKSVDFLQPQFENAIDRQALIEDSFSTIQAAFTLNANAYLIDKNMTSLKTAFELSEKYRSIDLRQSFTAQNSDITSGVDSRLIKKEKQLQAQINYLQKLVINKPEFKDSLYILNKNYNKLKLNFKKSAPQFYEAKYGNNISNLQQVQERLEHDQSIISYYFSQDQLYAFHIFKDNIELFDLGWLPSYHKTLEKLIQDITIPSSENIDSKIHTLSKVLIVPFANNLTARIIIIPDGSLHHLPFEILKLNNQWLLEQAAISYEESASLFKESALPAYDQVSLTAFAPFTNLKNVDTFVDSLPALNYAQAEFEFAQNHWDLTTFYGTDASLSRFRESINKTKANNLNIFHVASHAQASLMNVNHSYIAFNNENHVEKLQAHEIYNLKMTNSLVILSACETGVGEVVLGQGMRSFSQAFRYAGAQSLLHSKWKVSDYTTAIIMNAFYKELAQGKTKDVALQKAKINYLKQAPDARSKTPYYWAGFVVTGKVSALPSSSAWIWYLIAGILIATTAASIIYFKKH